MNTPILLDQEERIGRETGVGGGRKSENRWRKKTAEIVHQNKKKKKKTG